MTIKNDMDRLQYRKGGLLKLILKKGDTLFSIARDNELSIAELLEVNSQIKNPDEIYAGDTIFIPSKGKAPVAKEPSKQEGFLSMFRKKAVKRPKFVSYQIKKGKSCYKKSKQYSDRTKNKHTTIWYLCSTRFSKTNKFTSIKTQR